MQSVIIQIWVLNKLHKLYKLGTTCSILLIAFIFSACNQLKEEENLHTQENFDKASKKVTTKRFDTKVFFENEKHGIYTYQINDTIVTEVDKGNNYNISKSLADSPYYISEDYNKETGLLVKKQTMFITMPIGISEEYNNDGTLANQQNHEDTVKLSLEEFLEIIKTEYNLDVVKEYKQIQIGRGLNKNGHPIYSVYYTGHPVTSTHMTFDGITGKLLSKKSGRIE